LLGRGQRAPDVKLVSDIESNEPAAGVTGYHRAIVAASADDNLGTRVGIGLCDRQPDACGSARDERGLAGQLLFAHVAPISLMWLRSRVARTNEPIPKLHRAPTLVESEFEFKYGEASDSPVTLFVPPARGSDDRPQGR
jgi:hypothetical protein